MFDNWETVIGAAVGLVLIGFSVTTAGVREYASKHNYRVDVDQELLAQQVIEVLERDGFFDLVDRDHVHDNIEAAAAKHQELHPTASPG